MHAIRRYRLVPVLLLASGVTSVHAEQVYRSVDSEGHVTYSEEPPGEAAEVETVAIDPPPTEAEIEAARARQEKEQELVDELEQARKQRAKAREEAEEKKRRQALEQNQLQRLRQYDASRYDYSNAIWPYYPYYGRPPSWGPSPPQPSPGPAPPVRNSIANVPPKARK